MTCNFYRNVFLENAYDHTSFTSIYWFLWDSGMLALACFFTCKHLPKTFSDWRHFTNCFFRFYNYNLLRHTDYGMRSPYMYTRFVLTIRMFRWDKTSYLKIGKRQSWNGRYWNSVYKASVSQSVSRKEDHKVFERSCDLKKFYWKKSF